MQACKFGGNEVNTGFLRILGFHNVCILVVAKHGLNLVLVKGITTVMVLRHLLYAHLTNFEFVGVAWA